MLSNSQKSYLSAVIIVCSVLALGALRLGRSSNGAGDFPSRPITLICPYSAGGGTDLLARALARSAEETLGQTVTVNNITGGGGAVGFAAGLLAPPDGYTVTVVTFELVSLPEQGLVPFQHDDFDLLMRVNMDPATLAVQANCPANNVEEFITWARERGGVRIGNSGPGSVWHLASAIMVDALEIPATFVPFAGASPAVTALVGGHIDAVTVSPGEIRIQQDAGLLKNLGVMTPERLASIPGTPTFKEQGYDIAFGTWRGLAVPKGIPEDIRQKLTASFEAAMRTEAFKTLATRGGLNLAHADQKVFTDEVDSQSRQVTRIMERLELK